jgi:LacI family transcriptional regulator
MKPQPVDYKNQRKNIIGLIVPRINHNFFSNVIHGIESISNVHGYNLIICQSNESLNGEVDKIQALLEANVAGVIMSISSQTKNSVHIQNIINAGIPLVQLDRVNEDLYISKVVNDNESATFDSTKHLIEKGYKRIAYFSGPVYLKNYKDRLNGYKRAIVESNLPLDESLICENVITQELGIVAARELLSRKDCPDAICAAGDFSALGALEVIKDRNILVPQEMGIVGFSNEPFTMCITPSLTTLEQYSVDMGRNAAILLLDQISTPGCEPKTITLKPRLIVRNSTNRTLN